MAKKPARVSLASAAIFGLLEESRRHVYTWEALGDVLTRNRAAWSIPDYVQTDKFIEFLVTEGRLSVVPVKSEHYRSATRYIWGKASPFAVAVSLRPDAYLSHGSAVFLHGLTDQIAKVIYVNKEQGPKPRSTSPLAQ
jgi:hypothetical protein